MVSVSVRASADGSMAIDVDAEKRLRRPATPVGKVAGAHVFLCA